MQKASVGAVKEAGHLNSGTGGFLRSLRTALAMLLPFA